MTALRSQAPDALQLALDTLADRLRARQILTSTALAAEMTQAFGGPDTAGKWTWRQAYDVSEAALLLAAPALAAANAAPEATLAAFEAALNRLPTQSIRGEEQLRLQQFSTPLPLAYVMAVAAAIRPGELMLEPSAGVGALATAASLFGAKLLTNEIDGFRRRLLGKVLPGTAMPTLHNAEHIDDLLPPQQRPTLVLMNPPFVSSSTRADPAMAEKHLYAAFKRLAPGGRLVAILPTRFSEASPFWGKMRDRAVWRLRAQLTGALFRKNGTSIDTLFCVFDKLAPIGGGSEVDASVSSLSDLLALVTALPERPALASRSPLPALAAPVRSLVAVRAPVALPAPLTYAARSAPVFGAPVSDVYAAYVPQRIRIPGAKPHPTDLVESLAMASVLPPEPRYQPMLYPRLVETGTLSEAQLETVIAAGEAHSLFLPGRWSPDATGTALKADPTDGVEVRQGFFVGDGTGAGKGRQGAAIILDNVLKGRRLHLWISKSALLIEDARRDWSALGGNPYDVHDVAAWPVDSDLPMTSGILFLTWATLRSVGKRGRARLKQILACLGPDFDGVMLLDEAHALSNALALEDEEFGLQEGSAQGIAGLKLQVACPKARIVYASATGASKVEALVYAQRLGLWGSAETPFASLETFLTAMDAGGVAAMEIVARDLKALGLYCSRSLSMAGVEYEVLDHPLTDRQRAIYDTYAGAFQVIHANIEAALTVTGILDEYGRCKDKRARGVAISRFESIKQRFFAHLITGLGAGTLIKSIEADLAKGESVVLQLVSTGEALLNRRVPAGFTGPLEDDGLDLTPREFLLEYLEAAFPVHLFEEVENAQGAKILTPVFNPDGTPAVSREALALKDALMFRCAALEPVPTVLDQVLWHFGTDAVAEISGRDRRAVFKGKGADRQLVIEKRAAQANPAETDAFLSDRKRILAFTQAGGTGRSYHAAKGIANGRRRNHYVVEPGWQANEAVQGTGRSHRSDQITPPRYRILAVGVPSHKRFSSTIARRLEEMGALTKGQRQTGGGGLFRAEDNLESPYALAALTSFYVALIHGKAKSIGLADFERLSGLRLLNDDLTPVAEFPPIPRFLNRLLAFNLADQERIYAELEEIIAAKINAAKEAGTYDIGVEQLRGERIRVHDNDLVATHARTGAETRLYRITRDVPVHHDSAAKLLFAYEDGVPKINRETGEPSLWVPLADRFEEEDDPLAVRIKLIRPTERRNRYVSGIDGDWQIVDRQTFMRVWDAAVAALPTFETEELYVLAGLLLPIWRQVSQSSYRVYRVEAENHPALLGRIMSKAAAEALKAQVAPIDTTTPAGLLQALLHRSETITLTNDLSLRARKVAGRQRLEVEGAIEPVLDDLTALGCFAEIIQHRARVFVPYGEGDDGLAVLTALVGRFAMAG